MRLPAVLVANPSSHSTISTTNNVQSMAILPFPRSIGPSSSRRISQLALVHKDRYAPPMEVDKRMRRATLAIGAPLRDRQSQPRKMARRLPNSRGGYALSHSE